MVDIQGLPWASTVGVILAVLVARFVYTGYQVRKRFHYNSRLPGHSWIWGHMHLMPAVQRSMPAKVPPFQILYELARKNGLQDGFYFFDAWPFATPVLVSCSPAISDQFTTQHPTPKAILLRDTIWPVTGMNNLVTDEGQQWKTWRSAFNPGFSNAHLMTLLPVMIDAVEVFRRQLGRLASEGKPFRMEKYVTRLTIDIIAKVVLDMDLNAQVQDHPLVNAFEENCRWLRVGPQYDPSELWDIRRPYIFWKNQRIMNKLIGRELTQRWATRSQRNKSKHVVDLAIDTYLKEQGKVASSKTELDPAFIEAATNQVKTFLFAGHETSATTISYCFYYLAKRSDIAAKVTAELDAVFGKGTSIGQRIKEEPSLINKTDYLAAVVKEALRRHAPANAFRQGTPDFFIVDPDTGDRYPTSGIDMLATASGNHLHSGWGDPFAFRPERWVDKDVLEGAWIPFSKSPRNCIGQELALIEIRLTVAIAFRDFGFKACYDELEKLRDDDTPYTSDSVGQPELWGDEAYQCGVTAKPREGMPMRVYRRDE